MILLHLPSPVTLDYSNLKPSNLKTLHHHHHSSIVIIDRLFWVILCIQKLVVCGHEHVSIDLFYNNSMWFSYIYMYFHRFVTDEFNSINRDITIIETAHDWKKRNSCWNISKVILECFYNYVEMYCQLYQNIWDDIYLCIVYISMLRSVKPNNTGGRNKYSAICRVLRCSDIQEDVIFGRSIVAVIKSSKRPHLSDVQEGLLSLLDFQMFKCSFGEATFAQGEFIDVSRAPIFKRKLNFLGYFRIFCDQWNHFCPHN